MDELRIDQVNFHHLRYFWAVGIDGNLTRTAARLRVAQSALSAQIQHLETQLGQRLFDRRGRRLVLTEAGQIALTYADEIFRAGTQMIATLGRGRRSEQLLRIGAVATLSRNFQESFVKPLLMRPDVRLSLEAGLLVGLLHRLEQHELDLVLSNRAPPRGTDTTLRSRRIARQQVSIVGPRRAVRFRFPDDIDGARMLLPGRETDFRAEFDAMCEQLGVRPHILAEVDDMATMRLLARDIRALALVPRVVVRDELRARALHEQCAVPGLFETFYAVTAERMFQHPLVTMSLARTEDDLLETVPPRHRPTR